MTYASICASVMILLIAFIRMLFLKRLPKQCFRLLWLLAAIRLILPFSFTLEVELEQEIAERPRTVVIDTLDGGAEEDTAAVGTVSEQVRFDATEIIPLILLLGTLICGGFLTTAYMRMRRVAEKARIIEDETRGSVTVRTGDGAKLPFSCGVIRPIIFIPTQMFTLGERLDTIIAHERQHIRSGDQLLKWLIAAAVCMNWYNPLVWLMWHLANRDIELACDEAVVRRGKNNADYALTLIEAEQVRSTATVCSFGAPALNERIECIMKSKKLTVCGFISAALILAAMSVFFVQVTAAQSDDGYTVNGTADDTAEDIAEDITAPDVKYDIYVNDDNSDEENDNEEIDLTLVPADEIGSYTFTCPLAEYNAITGHFGEQVTPFGTVYFNTGVNVAAEKGTAVYAAAPGTVITAEYNTNNGNYIVIDHGDNCETVYRHLEALEIEIGDTVDVGDEIGTVGATGCVTGPNLGFAIIKDGTYISPEELFE